MSAVKFLLRAKEGLKLSQRACDEIVSAVTWLMEDRVDSKHGERDNIAAHSLAGYESLHPAFRKCQFCKAIEQDTKEKVSHSIFLWKGGHMVMN